MNLQSDAEIHIKQPSQFIIDNWQKLLPDWKTTPQTVIIVLLPSRFPLDSEGKTIEIEKDSLLKQFIKLGQDFSTACNQQGFLTEIISSKEGTPEYSARGELTFDLVAVVHQLLGFDFYQTTRGCKVLKHPKWQTAVYPGLALSLASVEVIELILKEITRTVILTYSRGQIV